MNALLSTEHSLPIGVGDVSAKRAFAPPPKKKKIGEGIFGQMFFFGNSGILIFFFHTYMFW